MTSLTNVHQLPEALVRAVKADPYTGGGDISVTKLIDAPQRRQLWIKHRHEVVEDVSDRIWSLLGQSVHHILQRAGEGDAGVRVEERLYATVDGWELSGQFDRLDLHDETLDDYKVCSVWSVGGKIEWERQLNVLRWLAIQNGHKVSSLRVIAILRDWKRSEVNRRENYPSKNVISISINVWNDKEVLTYVRNRIALHQRAAAGEAIPCSDEERWYAGTTYAVKKEGGKRAIRVYDKRDDIGPLDPGYIIEERPGEYRRCKEYCEVSAFCKQWENHDAADW